MIPIRRSPPQQSDPSTTSQISYRQVSLWFLLAVPFVLQVCGILGLVGCLSSQKDQKSIQQLVQQLDRHAEHNAEVLKSTFITEIHRETKITILFSMSTLILAAGSGAWTARRITRSMRSLQKAAQAIADGQLDQKTPTSRITELAQLSHTFNQMAVNLQQSFEELEDRVSRRTAAFQEAAEKYRSILSAQKQVEASLQRQILAMEAAGEGIAILQDNSFIYLNPAHLHLFGYQHPEELLGQNWQVLYEPEEIVRFKQEIFPLLLLHKHWQGEAIARRRDGSTFAEEVSLTLTETGDLVCVCRDITERQVTQNRLKQAKEVAEAANLAKSTFLANMSHELRTPLNAILGFTQLMERDATLNLTHRNYVEIINRSGEHLLSLINDILEISKIEAGQTTFIKHNFDLYRFLDSIGNLFQLKAEAKGLKLEIFYCAAEVPQWIRTDEGKLRQVLINLIDNAVKFTESGYIHINVQAQSLQLVSQVQEPTYQIWFEVEDSGPGMAAEELDNLFKPFVQTVVGQQSQQGTGLGLAISRKFIQLMGGEIMVRSAVEIGTIFSFFIQTHAVAATSSEQGRSMQRVIALAPHQPTYRLLVVDDIPENRYFLETLLRSVGFEIQAANNGEEAITKWQSWSPHLIWMDLRMPGMTGEAAMQHIRSQPKGAETIIIALTASVLNGEREVLLKKGFDDCIYKPFQQNVILEKLEHYLAVRFTYANTDQSGSLAPSMISEAIAAAMPTDWLESLHRAAKSGDDETIHELIAQIPAEQSSLRAMLTQITTDFAFDQILQYTSALEENTL